MEDRFFLFLSFFSMIRLILSSSKNHFKFKNYVLWTARLWSILSLWSHASSHGSLNPWCCTWKDDYLLLSVQGSFSSPILKTILCPFNNKQCLIYYYFFFFLKKRENQTSVISMKFVVWWEIQGKFVLIIFRLQNKYK